VKIEELEELADNAIAQWKDPNFSSSLVDEPTIWVYSASEERELLPGLKGRLVGFDDRTKQNVLMVNALLAKEAIAIFRQGFSTIRLRQRQRLI
jgi:hypothetical protein